MAAGARRKPVERRRVARSLPSSGVWTVALALVVLLVVGAVVVARTGGEDAAPTAGDAPGAFAGKDRTSGDTASDGPWDPYATTSDGRAATEAARSEWEPVVERFTDALLTSAPAGRWLSSLESLVTEQLADRLQQVDPDRLPGGRFVSAEIQASGDIAADVTVTVGSRRGEWALGVRIVDLPGDEAGWQVYSFDDRTSGEEA